MLPFVRIWKGGLECRSFQHLRSKLPWATGGQRQLMSTYASPYWHQRRPLSAAQSRDPPQATSKNRETAVKPPESLRNVNHQDFSLTGRYATALFRSILALPDATSVLDNVWKDMGILRSCLAEVPSPLKTIIETPGVNAARKIETMKSLTHHGFSEVTVRFLLLLLENKRLFLLAKVIDAFESFYREARGEILCFVTTAQNLSASEKLNVERALAELKPQHRLQISYSVVPSILGGLVVRIGNQTLDYSVATRVERIQVQLLAPFTATG